MRLVLDPAEEAAHGEWLRQTPGAYEWWYFDALSDDGQWALACIWFLGNPFSGYYRQASRGQPCSPFDHNALFFALYRNGTLYAYHFTRFPTSKIEAAETAPLCLRFGPNTLTVSTNGQWRLDLTDLNANGRQMQASLSFISPPLVPGVVEVSPHDTDHSWLPIAPFCRVKGRIDLAEVLNPKGESVRFTGTGYHDHNWGRLPFDAAVKEWYWVRAELNRERSAILYHVQPHQGTAISHLLLFESGRLLLHDAEANVRLSRPVFNGFLSRYHTELTAISPDLSAVFRFRNRLDSAPFYIRALCAATVIHLGQSETGQGIGEYLRPRPMSAPLAASAMKARIVEA